VAQASETSEPGARNSEGVDNATGRPPQQRSRDPKRWPVRHHKGQGSGNAQPKKRSRTVPETGDQNAELCTGCGKGGHLYCCDGCPRVWHAACLQERGRVPPRSEGQWYGPCCSEEQTGVGVLPASGQSRGTAGGEGSEGLRSQGSQERGSEPGEVRIGTPGQQVRYVYTGRRSERSPYIAEREHKACMALPEGRCYRCTTRIGGGYVCLTKRRTCSMILPRGIYGSRGQAR